MEILVAFLEENQLRQSPAIQAEIIPSLVNAVFVCAYKHITDCKAFLRQMDM